MEFEFTKLHVVALVIITVSILIAFLAMVARGVEDEREATINKGHQDSKSVIDK
jgi:hypothetical protein